MSTVDALTYPFPAECPFALPPEMGRLRRVTDFRASDLHRPHDVTPARGTIL